METLSQILKDGRDVFHYDSLGGQPMDAIRLLRFIPGISDRINCTLATACLDTEPKFKALSCMWGTETPNRIIEINGKPFLVRPNLFEAEAY